MQNPPAFGFGTPTASQPVASGLTFGAGANTAPTNLFGAGSASTGGGLFGAKTTGTATPSLFGTPTTSTLGTPAFGATSTPTFGAAFGAAATPSFASAAATPSFASTAANSTNSGFGGATATTPAFGAPASNVPAFGSAAPNFGTSNTSLSFGPTPNTALSSASTAPTFGASGFGSITATTAPTGFTGLGATQTTTSGFGLTPSTSLSFGAASTAAPSFGFGATTTTGPALSTAPSFNLGASAASIPTTSAAPVGLGGLATTQTKVVAAQKDVTPKDQPLPNEILQTVEGFKEFVKQQKMHSSDIARCSVRDFRKVEQDINQLTQLLSEVESQLQKNRQLAEKLKYDTAKCLKDVEIAQRTQDTPPGLQYENIAPLRFFLNLADKFERDMQILKIQIEGADNYVKNYRSPNALTPSDLHLGMRRLHESFVALAGRLHSVHAQVESQKEAYLYTRKHLFNDHTNPFEEMYSPTEDNFKQILNYSPPKVATGPTPFGHLALGINQPFSSQQNQSGTPTTFGTGYAGSSYGGEYGVQTILFGNASTQNSNAFQLQKPPTGNKRGKP